MKQPDIPRSGKRGKWVWQNGPHGQYFHALVVPANPRTRAQWETRGLFAQIKMRWARITEEQRRLWIADGSKTQSHPRLGQRGPLPGNVLFQKINYTLAVYGRPQVDVPPPKPIFSPPAVKALLITNLAGLVKILLVCPADPGDFTMLHASVPRRPRGRSCTDYRFIGPCPAPIDGLADITALYTAKFRPLRAGEKIFLQSIQMIDGWESRPDGFSATVPFPP